MAKHVLRVGFRIPYFEVTLIILVLGLFVAGLYVGRYQSEIEAYAKSILNNSTSTHTTQAHKSPL
jgi:hypothetical protein